MYLVLLALTNLYKNVTIYIEYFNFIDWRFYDVIKYNKLFSVLALKGMKKTDLLAVITSPTLAKLSKGAVIQTEIIDRLCEFLSCQPGDIMEWIPKEKGVGIN